ncbi:hypothetical protein SAMN05216410_0988 [Sanguibacter gelidistatuariae]|uniref:DUF1684 domain-containing protein n=1 Tax=Sanguibacter gelidistatuariae TaxID=1814289 RepID=A0A1G6HFN3_9MICO|nr:DUF1684 domain-containing protein [Sanguibacter gelidistatuariae]SDB93050.1 hypothetical protein SAMN05216410_0988 [Sanguibacter gelidistatuariae]
MTITDPTPAAPTTAAPSADAADWQAWRASREEGLTGEHGWLTLTALHHLPATPQALPGLPGQWWADADGAHVRAAADEAIRALDTRIGLEATDQPLDGVHTVVVPEAASTVAAIAGDNRAVEVALRTGGYIARVRDPEAPARASFSGVPTYAYDPSWVLEAPVRWYDEPVAAVVGAAQLGLRHDVVVIGELDLTRDGLTATLKITGKGPDTATVLFSEENDATAEWRILFLDSAAGASAAGEAPVTVRLDLNRTLNLPYAFSDFGTCPRPVEGNHVPFAVTAGEQVPTVHTPAVHTPAVQAPAATTPGTRLPQ